MFINYIFTDLIEKSYSFGRDPSNHMYIPSVNASKLHFEIQLVSDNLVEVYLHFQIGDLPCLVDYSSNGTMVNNEMAHKRKVGI